MELINFILDSTHFRVNICLTFIMYIVRHIIFNVVFSVHDRLLIAHDKYSLLSARKNGILMVIGLSFGVIFVSWAIFAILLIFK